MLYYRYFMYHLYTTGVFIELEDRYLFEYLNESLQEAASAEQSSNVTNLTPVPHVNISIRAQALKLNTIDPFRAKLEGEKA